MRDVRICFVGDSFVAGTGDPQARGWVGRIAERTVPLLGAVTAYNLAQLAAQAEAYPLFVVGPPPIADAEQNERMAVLDGAFAAWCRDQQVPYVSVFGPLSDGGPWLPEVRAGDRSHPVGLGYDQLAEAVWAGGWTEWLGIT